MHDGDHRFSGYARVAMGDLYGDLFMLAEQHRRIVLAVVDQRIVQPAITGTWVKRNVFKPVAFDHVDDDVRLPSSIGFFDG